MSVHTRSRRILMTLDAVGGVWRYAMELGEAIKPLGYHTLFVGFGLKPSLAQTMEAQRIGDLEWLPQPLDWLADDERDLDGIGEAIESLASDQAIDLIHLNLPSQAANLSSRRPVVAVSHSCVVTWWQAMRSEPLPSDWLWKKRLNETGFANSDAIVAPSESHAALLRSCYSLPLEVSVIHNAMAADLGGGPKEPFVFAAGRWWDESKNARLLDQAARAAAWPIRMAGSTHSPSGQTVELLHAEHLGELSYGTLLDQVRRAGIVVSPSLYEPFGLLPLEGARAGAALALADIPTYRELWEDCALFFAPTEPDALVAVINRYAEDPMVREEMGRRAVRRSQTFTPHNQAAAMASLYDFHLAPARSRRAGGA